MKMFFKSLILLSCTLGISNCGEHLRNSHEQNENMQKLTYFLASIQNENTEAYSGGDTTVFDTTVNAFNFQAANLKGDKTLSFQSGNSLFNTAWVQNDSSGSRKGLGPLFNGTSCNSCHLMDGRGRPPIGDEKILSSMLIRLSQPGVDSKTGGPVGLDNYGGQMQDKAITDGGSSVIAEGNVTISYQEITGSFPDGEIYSLRKPTYIFTWTYGEPSNFLYSPRVAQEMPGRGLLEMISEETILALSDPDDKDGDGISGKPNYVWDFSTSTIKLGRFGWKANQPSLAQQTQGAFLGDIGITSPLFTNENCVKITTEDCVSANNGHPEGTEISKEMVDAVVFYSQLLAVPGRRNWKDSIVKTGKQKFVEIGCSKCHVANFKTGSGEIQELSNQNIFPYSDLLLHDMGDDLADNRPDFEANGNEWRTPPLWGIGLSETVTKHNFFLHDGRARGMKEAILWHGGEAESSKEKFKSLAKSDREAIIKFLSSL